MELMDETKFFTKIIPSAIHSVDVIVGMGVGFAITLENYDLYNLADNALNLRCILTAMNAQHEGIITEQKKQAFKSSRNIISQFGFETKIVPRKPTINCIIVDGSKVLFSDLSLENHNHKSKTYFTNDPLLVNNIISHFNQLWSPNRVELLHEDLILSTIPIYGDTIIAISSKRWNDLFWDFSTNPEKLRNINPFLFEELVAELLIRDGMNIKLTDSRKDGGRDIIASCDTPAGKHLYLVECKRYAEHNKVGVELIRALYGIVESERATGGLLVTTSSFTKGAIQFSKTNENRLWLKEYGEVVDWIKKNRQ